jgi:hypothetical protein
MKDSAQAKWCPTIRTWIGQPIRRALTTKTTSEMMPDELAAAGRALYGERWQTPLSHDLHVTDRTVRRWLVGGSQIPDGVESELREVLIRRVKEIGGMIRYSVNTTDRSVLHYPTGAVFQYDDARGLTLLNDKMVAHHDIPLITKGAKEALREELERNPTIRGRFTQNV